MKRNLKDRVHEYLESYQILQQNVVELSNIVSQKLISLVYYR